MYEAIIRERVEQIFTNHTNFQPPKVIFSNKMKVTAGTAYTSYSNPDRNKIVFSKSLMEENFNSFLNDTVPHECAHIIANLREQKNQNHNHVWADVCREIGLQNPKRCHDFNTQNGKRKQFNAVCSKCGERFKIGAIRAKRMRENKKIYSHIDCGGRIYLED